MLNIFPSHWGLSQFNPCSFESVREVLCPLPWWVLQETDQQKCLEKYNWDWPSLCEFLFWCFTLHMQWRHFGLLGTLCYWLLVGFNDPSAQTRKHKHADCALKKCHWESGWSSVLPEEAKQLLQPCSLGQWNRVIRAVSEPHELCIHGLASHTVPPHLGGFIMMMVLFLVSPKSIREITVWDTKGIEDLSLRGPFQGFWVLTLRML